MSEEMFIEDLPKSLVGNAAAGPTTQALGEEGEAPRRTAR